jgi:hypothetical protein
MTDSDIARHVVEWVELRPLSADDLLDAATNREKFAAVWLDTAADIEKRIDKHPPSQQDDRPLAYTTDGAKRPTHRSNNFARRTGQR